MGDGLKRAMAAAKATRPKAPKNWKCQECGRRMTLAAADKAMNGVNGCPKCGGSDIDLATETDW